MLKPARVRRFIPAFSALVALVVCITPSSVVQAKALASVALNITSLIWYKDDGDGIAFTLGPGGEQIHDPGDIPLVAYAANDSVKLGDLSVGAALTPNIAAINANASLGTEESASDIRNFANVAVPLDLPQQCSGPGCVPTPPYSENDFTSTPLLADPSGNYAYADQLLENAAFGFGVTSEGAPVVPAGAVIGMRSDVSLPDMSSGVADSSPEILTLNSTARVTPKTQLTTYFAVAYSLAATAGLDSMEGVGSYAEATWNFNIGIQGINVLPWAELNGNVSLADGEGEQGVSSSGTLYSTEMYTLAANIAKTITVQAQVSAAAISTAVPTPTTLALFLIGGLARFAVVRRRRMG